MTQKIVEKAKIQIKRGLESETGTPILDAGEFGWAMDTQKLYIGNGTLAEGARAEGVTEIYPGQSVSALIARIVTLEAKVAALEARGV